MNQSHKEDLFRRDFERSLAARVQNHSPGRKSKRYRSAFTTEQINYLENEFKKCPYIGNAQRKLVASALSIPERAIKIWFQNRRMKEKKDVMSREMDDDDLRYDQAVEYQHDQLNVHDTSLANRSYSLPHLAMTDNITNDIANDKDFSDMLKLHDIPNNTINETKHTKSALCYSEIQPSNSLKASGKFSIELCKKYKHERKKHVDDAVSSIKQEMKAETSLYQPIDQVSPQDLSISRTKVQPETSVAVTSTDYMPLYMEPVYSQPYLPSGNVLWKPVNVMPMLPEPTPAPIPNYQPSIVKSCTCNCHSPSTMPSPYVPPITFPNNVGQSTQYVITAVPFPMHPSNHKL